MSKSGNKLFNSLFPSYQSTVKADNMASMNGIGPMALVNVIRTIISMAGVNIDGVHYTTTGLLK